MGESGERPKRGWKMKLWRTLAAILLLALPSALMGQWAVISDPGRGGARSVLETPDGGAVLAGFNCLAKLTSGGQVVWGWSFDMAKATEAGKLKAWLNPNGGCLAARNDEIDGGVALFELSPAGAVLWQKKYTLLNTLVPSFCRTADGGVIMAGGSAGADIILVKCLPGGDIEWQRSYGTEDRSEVVTGLAPTADGGYVLIGSSFLPNDPVVSADLWVLKLTGAGEIQWQELIGGAAEDGAEYIHQTDDGGYLVAGHSASFSTDSQAYFWLMKLSASGAIEAQTTLGYRYGGGLGWLSFDALDDGTFTAAVQPAGLEPPARACILTILSDGTIIRKMGYPMANGYLNNVTMSPTADLGCVLAMSGNEESLGTNSDVQVIKLSAAGEIEWQKIYGSRFSYDAVHAVRQLSGGAYMFVGATGSWSGLSNAAWYMKLAPDGTLGPNYYFVKDADSVALEESVSPGQAQATAVSTSVTPGAAAIVAETAGITFGAWGTKPFIPMDTPICTLTLGVQDENGTTTPEPGIHVYGTGTTVQLTARPNADYSFFQWFGNVTTQGNYSIPLLMDGDKKVTAQFAYSGETDPVDIVECFIATAAYGSPTDPNVEILRAFRDRYLLRSRAGRAFVDLYYRYSPALARFINGHPALKPVCRVLLYPAVVLSSALLRLNL
jgi:hypothetical protein